MPALTRLHRALPQRTRMKKRATMRHCWACAMSWASASHLIWYSDAQVLSFDGLIGLPGSSLWGGSGANQQDKATRTIHELERPFGRRNQPAAQPAEPGMTAELNRQRVLNML